VTRAQAERLLEAWRQRLTPEWAVAIDWAAHPEQENHRAACEHSQRYLVAEVQLARDWLDSSAHHLYAGQDVAAEREVDLVHELVHLLHRDVDRAAQVSGETLGREAAHVAGERYRDALEGHVERVARSLVALAPLRP
jgi:hypothetical protein